MELIEVVRGAWGFTGLVPVRILDVNAFGNLLVAEPSGRVWRICPEELSCEPVAESPDELARIRLSDDWKMERLVDIATTSLGTPGNGRCFCMKIPGVLGGEYVAANFGTITLAELVAASGDMALQIKDLPDGAQIRSWSDRLTSRCSRPGASVAALPLAPATERQYR
jgi:hypothetical protein